MTNFQKLESFDSGSNYQFGDKMLFENAPRSKFDLTHKNTLTIPNAGLCTPIAWLETNPNEDFDISVDALVRVLPSVVPLYSRQRMYIYGFYSRCSDLDSTWQVHARKGYSGNEVTLRPSLNADNLYMPNGNEEIVADSLGDYLDLPIGASLEDLAGAGLCAHVPMMWLSVWANYFMNKNYFINDRILLPDDPSRFRLDKNGQLLSAVDAGKKIMFDLSGKGTDIRYDDDGNLIVGQFYHDYPSDRFTSSLPWAQRGNTPTVPFDISTQGLSVGGTLGGHADFSSTVDPQPMPGNAEIVLPLALNYIPDGNGSTDAYLGLYAPSSSSGAGATPPQNVGFDYYENPQQTYLPQSFGAINGRFFEHLNKPDLGSGLVDNPSLTDVLNKNSLASADLSGLTIQGNNINTTLTVEALRKVLIEQHELEYMARTDGSYGQFGLTFFGERSKAAYDYKPLYIGGTYKNMVFTEVLQTSAGASGQTPLGTYAGHGISGISNGRIGRFHSDDWGYILLVACIMPDVSYSQGIDKKWTKLSQSELFLPSRAKLGLQPVLNRELFYAGNNSDAVGGDNFLWAYNNPFDEFRYTPNKIHGKIADPQNNSFKVYTQSRFFDTLPNWSRDFAEANDVRKDYLQASIEDAYTADFMINIRAVRPLPYKPVPAELI